MLVYINKHHVSTAIYLSKSCFNVGLLSPEGVTTLMDFMQNMKYIMILDQNLILN